MNKLSFFTPINFSRQKTITESCIEKIENFFYWGGKKAHIISGHEAQGSQGVLLRDEESPSHISMAIKVASYVAGFPLLLPLLLIKTAYRYTHKFYQIDVEQQLSKGINITPEIINKIETLRSSILDETQDPPEIERYNSRIYTIFSLKSHPDLIFKYNPVRNKERYENMVKALGTCLIDQLDQLVIPAAKRIQVKGYEGTLIAEKMLPVPKHFSAQKRAYFSNSGKLDKAVSQLAILIIKTGLTDIEWRNVPVILDKPEVLQMRIGCIDTDLMGNPASGLFGSAFPLMQRGLINCLFSEKQIDSVINIARQHKIKPEYSNVVSLKKHRMQEVEHALQLEKFYQRHQINENNVDKPLRVDLETLDLNLNEQITLTPRDMNKVHEINHIATSNKGSVTVKLGNVARDVIDIINKQLAENKKTRIGASIDNIRELTLETHSGEGLPTNNLRLYSSLGFKRETKNPSWLFRILKALEKKGFLYNIQPSETLAYPLTTFTVQA